MSDMSEEEPPPISDMTYMSARDVRRTILGSSPAYNPSDVDGSFEVRNEENCSVSSNLKRTRDESSAVEDNEGFVMVTRKKKLNLRRSPSHDNGNLSQVMEDEPSFYEVAVSSQDLLPKQLAFAKILNTENVQDIEKVSYKNPYKVLIRLKSSVAAEKFMNCENNKKRGWICRKTSEVTYTYGIIRDIDIDIEEKEIKKILESEVEILAIKRLLKKNEGGEWVKSETIRIAFQGATLPTYVKAYGCRLRVEPFMFPVTQCSKCWKYGHVKHFCPAKSQVCPKCGGEHINCTTEIFKCVNCKGNHMSFFKSECPAFLRERNIRIYMSQNNTTYKVALRSVNQEREKRDLNNRERFIDPEQNKRIVTEKSNTSSSYADVLKNYNEEDMEIQETVEPTSSKSKGNTSKNNKKTKDKKQKDKIESCELQLTLSSDEDKSMESEKEEESRNLKKRKHKKSLFSQFLDRVCKIIISDNDTSTKINMVFSIVKGLVIEFCKSYFSAEYILKLITESYNVTNKI